MKSFIKVFAIIYIPFSVSALIVFYFLNSLLLESAELELLQELRNKWDILLINEVDQKEKNERHALIHEIFENTKLRITFIEKSGIVLDDGYIDFAKVSEMENHRKRPEIIQAFNSEEGHSSRYSFTTNMEMLYFAKRVSENLVMRIAYPKIHVMEVKETFSNQVSWIFLGLFFITAIITVLLARRISVPLQKLDYIAESLEAGKSNVTFPTFYDNTMMKVSDLIQRIYQAMLSKQQILQEEYEKRNYIYGILDEGIILLNEENEILYLNENAQKYLKIDLAEGMNLLKDIDDFEVIDFFTDILSNKDNNVWKEKELKSRLFDLNLRIGFSTQNKSIGDAKGFAGDENKAREKLLIFYDITEKVKYQKYKSKLVGNISHELRTPLSMIMGYAETILNEPKMAEKTRNRFLEKIFNNSKRINGIIADVLELHKLESMGFDFRTRENTSIKEVVLDLKAQYGKITEKKINFECRVEDVNVNFEHLFSILSNLIGNAIKYSTGQTIDVEIQSQNKEVILSVEDEGPIISGEDQHRIFERFYTASTSRNKAYSGTGLGLPIVKHIAQLYDGDIKLEKGTKSGNRFVVTLY